LPVAGFQLPVEHDALQELATGNRPLVTSLTTLTTPTMEPLQEHIRRIQEKLQQLVKQYSALQKENEKLSLQLSLLKEKESIQHQQIDELNQQVSLLKAAKSGMSEEDKKDFEKRINQYLKEIDKCIAMLQE
jgi:archaellum component FlaC